MSRQPPKVISVGRVTNQEGLGLEDGRQAAPPAVVHSTPGSFVMNQQQLLSLTSVLRSRAELASRMGQQFGGTRNLYDVLGYKRILDYDDYLGRYTRDSIAKRIVAAPAEATWTNKPIIVPKKDGNNKTSMKEFNKKWDTICTRLDLIQRMNRADKLAGIGQYGLLLIGVNDGRKLDQPIGKVRNNDNGKDILFAQPYSQQHSDIEKIVTDPTNERLGKPEFYSIQIGNIARGTSTIPKEILPQKVHHSRVIHIAEGLLEDDIFGTPRLEAVYNLFDDLAKTVGGSAEFFWRVADRGMHFDIDKDTEYNSEDEAGLVTEIENYIHGLQRTIQTRGVTSKVLGSENADPRGPFSAIISLISGATGIPQRILLGSERGQLASSQDKASWNERTAERQRNFAEPRLLRPTIDLFISVGALPDEEYDIDWPVLHPQSEDERSIITQRLAAAIKTITQQVSGQIVVTPDEFRKDYLGLDPLPKELKDENEEVKDAELENKKSPPDLKVVDGGGENGKENDGVGKGQKEKSEEPIEEKKSAAP